MGAKAGRWQLLATADENVHAMKLRWVVHRGYTQCAQGSRFH